MRLTPDQLARFADLGYVFIPDCFALKEVDALRAAAADILAQQRPEIWREKDGTPRTAFGDRGRPLSGVALVARRTGSWRRWFARLRGPLVGRLHVEIARIALTMVALCVSALVSRALRRCSP